MSSDRSDNLLLLSWTTFSDSSQCNWEEPRLKGMQETGAPRAKGWKKGRQDQEYSEKWETMETEVTGD